MMQYYDRTKITEEPARVLAHRKPRITSPMEAKIKNIMNPGEWVDTYAITARLGFYPQSRYFGAIVKILNPMIEDGQIEAKPGNLNTPFYRLVAPVICAESIQSEQRGERFSLRRMK